MVARVTPGFDKSDTELPVDIWIRQVWSILEHPIHNLLLPKHQPLSRSGYRIQNAVIAKIISGVPDKMSSRPSALCQTFWAAVRHFSQLMTGKYQWSFLFSLSDILCVLNSAGQNVQHGLSSLPDISRSLLDMSGIFRDDWFWMRNCTAKIGHFRLVFCRDGNYRKTLHFLRKSIKQICLSTITFSCPWLDQTYRLVKIGRI